MTAAAVFQQPAAGHVKPPLGPPAGALATHVIDVVKHAAATAPRSLQAAAGPSELGTPCDRRLAYRALDWEPKPNSDTDPWASIQGTSVHAWMAEQFHTLNREPYRSDVIEVNGAPYHRRINRYLVEHRVTLPGGITGSCDLFDRDSGDVIDWKVTSANNLAKYRRNGPGQQYAWQSHLYGLGLQLQGEHVERVNIVFLPRGGRLTDLHVWTEPYDYRVAIAALERWQTIQTLHVTLDPEAHPERWALIPTGPAHCLWCPWHLPGSTDPSKGCPGHQSQER